MLAIGKSIDLHGFTSKILLAIDERSDTHIYHVNADIEDLPMQKLTGDSIFDWIQPDQYHKLIKKWSLTKKESKLIQEFYSVREQDEFYLGEHDNYRVRSAFGEIEKLLIHSLKRIYKGTNSMKLTPYLDGQVFSMGSTANVTIQGASGAGKTTWAVEQLMKPAYSKHHIVIISATPEDKSFDPLRSRKKKITTFVDIDLIKEPLSIRLLKNRDGRPTLLFIDDVFDSLSQRANSAQAQVRLWISDLATDILTRGRVNNMSVWTVLHRPKGGRITENLYGESSLVVIFPRNNREIYAKMCREKLGIPKKKCSEIFERAGNSRYICFRIANPTYALWQTGMMLI